MLVLSRKVGERVVIGGGVTVVVTRVVGNRVTLGIDAPANVHVLRGELVGAEFSRGAAAPANASTGDVGAAAKPETSAAAQPATFAVLAAAAVSSPVSATSP